FLVDEGFRWEELWTPRLALESLGVPTEVAAPKVGRVHVQKGREQVYDAQATVALADVDPDNYAGLVIPGGTSVQSLIGNAETTRICRAFMQSGKPVGAVTEAPGLLMQAGLLENRVIACYFAVANQNPEAWKQGRYGKYLEQPVVRDGNLITCRHPREINHFAKTFAYRAAGDEGREATEGRHKMLLVGSGMEPHDARTLTTIGRLLGIWVHALDEKHLPGQIKTGRLTPKNYSSIFFVDGQRGPEKMMAIEGFGELIDSFRIAKKPVIATPKAAEALKKAKLPEGLTEVPSDFHKASPIAIKMTLDNPLPEHRRRKRPRNPKLPPIIGLLLTDGRFDAKAYSAVTARLRMMGHPVVPLGVQGGFIKSTEGVPVAVKPFTDFENLGKHGITIVGSQVKTMGSEVAEVVNQLQPLAALAAADKTFSPPGGQYPVAIAMHDNFDDRVYAALRAHFQLAGKPSVVIADKPGKLTGLNGTVVNVDATYENGNLKLAKDAIIVAPGGIWPEPARPPRLRGKNAKKNEKEEELDPDEIREKWIVDRWKNGAILMLFGMDSLVIGRHREFRGKYFSAPDQMSWSFGRFGARYHHRDPVTKSGPRIITAETFDQVHQALWTLEEKNKPEHMQKKK
ncbi:MAG: DJ-1/PfpI family protein, partial [Phycisphaerae bacterium]